VLVADDPQSPTTKEVPIMLQAIERFSTETAQVMIPVIAPPATEAEAKNMEIAKHHVLNRKLWPGESPDEEKARVKSYMDLLQQAHGYTREGQPIKFQGPRDLALDRLQAVSIALEAKLKNREQGQ
jgi:hypothetical protein